MTANRFVPLILLATLFLNGCKLKDQVRSFLQGEDRSMAAVSIGGKTYSRSDLEHFFDSRLSEFRDPTPVSRAGRQCGRPGAGVLPARRVRAPAR